MDDIARTLYGKDVYSLEDEELGSVKGLYWKAVSDVLEARASLYIAAGEKGKVSTTSTVDLYNALLK